MKPNTVEPQDRSISAFCRALGLSRAGFYNLAPDKRPKLVQLGRRKFVAETVEQYLARLAAEQEV